MLCAVIIVGAREALLMVHVSETKTNALARLQVPHQQSHRTQHARLTHRNYFHTHERD